MKVSDVMTKRVISVLPETSLADAIEMMTKHHISGMPVIDEKGGLVGMISEGDLLSRIETLKLHRRSRWYDAFFGPRATAPSYVRSHGRRVYHVMSSNPVTVGEQTPLDEVVRLMDINNIKRLPVIRDGKPVGIVSRANLMRALASIIREAPKFSEDDASLRTCILDEIENQNWSTGAAVDVLIRNGTADLWGTIIDESQREALKVLIENMPGVTSVNDHVRLQ